MPTVFWLPTVLSVQVYIFDNGEGAWTNRGGHAMSTTLMMLVGGLMLVIAGAYVWIKRTKK